MSSPALGLELCSERCPLGPYKGDACCLPKGHDEAHAITSGQTEPPYSRVVYEWPRSPTIPLRGGANG